MDDSAIISTAIATGAMAGNDNGTYYCGYSLRETAGAAAVVRVRMATVAGVILDEISFAANENVSDYYGDSPLYCDGKIFIELVSGTLPEGSIRHK